MDRLKNQGNKTDSGKVKYWRISQHNIKIWLPNVESDFVCVWSSGVIAVSWYPPSTNDDNGEPLDEIMPSLLEVAHKYHIKVSSIKLHAFWEILSDVEQIRWKIYFSISRLCFILSPTKEEMKSTCLPMSNTSLRSKCCFRLADFIAVFHNQWIKSLYLQLFANVFSLDTETIQLFSSIEQMPASSFHFSMCMTRTWLTRSNGPSCLNTQKAGASGTHRMTGSSSPCWSKKSIKGRSWPQGLMASTPISPPMVLPTAPLSATGSPSKLSARITTSYSFLAWAQDTSTPASGRGTLKTLETASTANTTKPHWALRWSQGRILSPLRLLMSGTRGLRLRQQFQKRV